MDEQTLKKLQRIYDQADSFGKELMEKEFPELKESEDERIKKCIGMCLTDATEQRFEDFNTTLKDCLTWLEKQSKENTELPKGEDYGIDSLYHAARILEKTLGEVDGYQSDDGILEHECAIEAVKRLYEQEPVWTEEDEHAMNQIIACLRGQINSDLPEMTNWIKSIKQRLTLQTEKESN